MVTRNATVTISLSKFSRLGEASQGQRKVLAASSWISLAATIAELPNQVLPVKVKHVSSVARPLTLHCNLAREI